MDKFLPSPRLNVTSVAACCALLYVFRSVVAPFVMAFVLAILVDALLRSRFFPKIGLWPVRVLVGATLGGGIVLGAAAVVLGGLRSVAEQAPLLVERLDALALELGRMAGLEQPLGLDVLAGSFNLGLVVTQALSGVQEAMSGTVLTLVFLILILTSKSLIRAKVMQLAALGPPRRTLLVLERSIRGVEAYVWIQTVTGLMIAVASGAVMALAGLDDVLFWTLALFLLSYIPIFGVAIGSVAPALFALMQFPTAWPALFIFAGIQAVAFLVGNLVLPKMQADAQNIDPAMGLLVTGVWTVLWGIPGAFLAVPLTLALMFFLAQHDGLRWLAVLVSNNGDPLPELRGDGFETPAWPSERSA